MKFAHTTGPCLSHQHIILKPDASELVITLLPCEGCPEYALQTLLPHPLLPSIHDRRQCMIWYQMCHNTLKNIESMCRVTQYTFGHDTTKFLLFWSQT